MVLIRQNYRMCPNRCSASYSTLQYAYLNAGCRFCGAGLTGAAAYGWWRGARLAGGGEGVEEACDEVEAQSAIGADRLRYRVPPRCPPYTHRRGGTAAGPSTCPSMWASRWRTPDRRTQRTMRLQEGFHEWRVPKATVSSYRYIISAQSYRTFAEVTVDGSDSFRWSWLHAAELRVLRRRRRSGSGYRNLVIRSGPLTQRRRR